MAYVLLAPVSQAQSIGQSQLNWPAFEQYQAQGQLLLFAPASQAQGHLLIWPELNQTHLWLPVARYWQQRNWEVRLLLPDTPQQVFDPSSEQPSPVQQAWLELQLARLIELTETPSEQAADGNTSTGLSAGLGAGLSAGLSADRNAATTETSDQAADKNGTRPVVMITQGSAALWYQQWVDSEQLPAPQALILFDALPHTFAQQNMLAVSLARSPYPILDIYRRPDSPLAWHNQQRRQQQLNRREKTGYARQRFNSPESLNKQIAGWLVRLGWLPLPPSAPKYLQEQHSESGISRPRNAAATGPAAPP